MYYIILKKQNQDIGTKIKNLKIKNPINSSHRKNNWLVFFFAHIGKKLVMTFGSNEGVSGGVGYPSYFEKIGWVNNDIPDPM